MKLTSVFAAVIVAVSAVTDLEKWEQFKKNHNKAYKDILEERTRFSIFKNILRDIEEHNIRYNKGQETYYKDINQFSDWTRKEFQEYLSFKIPTISSNEKFVRDPNFIAPEFLDWRDSGAVLGVKDQGSCGSCWAFSATGAMEGQSILKLNQRVSLSEQELLDCSSSYGNQGCRGGFMDAAFTYTQFHGIATEEDYPYAAHAGTCQSPRRSSVNVTRYVELDSTEDALLEGIAIIGPISIGMNGDLLQSYKGGIFNDSSCEYKYNHAVLVVGYGTENNIPYWIVKNSWGNYWGENGYFRFIRNANKQCGLGDYNIYPIVV